MDLLGENYKKYNILFFKWEICEKKTKIPAKQAFNKYIESIKGMNDINRFCYSIRLYFRYKKFCWIELTIFKISFECFS